jgi:hypothetical protein
MVSITLVDRLEYTLPGYNSKHSPLVKRYGSRECASTLCVAGGATAQTHEPHAGRTHAIECSVSWSEAPLATGNEREERG